MPERFEVVALMTDVVEDEVRSRLVDRMRERFSPKIGYPVEVLAHGNGVWNKQPWAGEVGKYPLSGGLQLSIYFSSPHQSGYTVLGVRADKRRAAYSLSLPSSRLLTDLGEASALIADLYSEVVALGLSCIVVAGAEYELGAPLPSASEVMESTGNLGSLIDYIAAEPAVVLGLSQFTLVKEDVGFSTFVRTSLLERIRS